MEEKMTEESGPTEEKKPTAENLWDTTRKTFKNFIHQVTCYIQLVQKKIELFVLTRKVSAARGDLGKAIDESRGAGDTDSFEKAEVKTALQAVDTLRQNITQLTNEIENLTKETQKSTTEPSEPAQQ
jgi:hypothetical protein